MEYYAIKNPIGSIIKFITAYNETNVSLRKEMILEWFEHQSPSLNIINRESIFSKYDSLLNFELDLIDQIFVDLGWQTFIVKPLFEEKFALLNQNGFIDTQNGAIILSELGQYLFSKQIYNQYIESLSFKANFWQLNNVKITDNKFMGSGSFIGKNKIVTCKHVMDELDMEKILIEDESSKRYTIKSIKRSPSENIDLLIIETEKEFNFFPYEIEESTNLVERVIVFGYPPIPLTTKPFLITNLGEISAEVDNCTDGTDCLILSTITRPGNRGGPILNKFGKLIGIMSQNRQHQITFTEENIRNIDINKGLGYATALKAKYILEII